MDELILLIKEIYTKDDIGQMVPQKPGRAVWATLKSADQQRDRRPDHRI